MTWLNRNSEDTDVDTDGATESNANDSVIVIEPEDVLSDGDSPAPGSADADTDVASWDSPSHWRHAVRPDAPESEADLDSDTELDSEPVAELEPVSDPTTSTGLEPAAELETPADQDVVVEPLPGTIEASELTPPTELAPAAELTPSTELTPAGVTATATPEQTDERWHEVLAGFIDDPSASVTAAAALIEEELTSYIEFLNQRKLALAANGQAQSSAGTEELRLALRGYRDLGKHLTGSMRELA